MTRMFRMLIVTAGVLAALAGCTRKHEVRNVAPATSPVVAPPQPQIMYFTNWEAGTFVKYDLGSRTKLGEFKVPGGFPVSIALDRDGNVYVRAEDAVQKFSPDGTSIGAFVNVPGDGRGMAFDQAGNLYVAQAFSGSILKFSPAGANMGIFAHVGNDPQGLAFDAAGNLYVAVQNAGEVHKFGPGGNDLGVFTRTAGAQPFGLAFDGDGNLFVANWSSGPTVSKYSPAGTSLGIFADSHSGAPQGIAFDAGGNLYVAHAPSDTIHKFGPSGTDLGALAEGLHDPVYMVLWPVAAKKQ